MQHSNCHKGLELWAKSINDFGNFGRHFPCATSAKILAAMYARVPQAMAQFVLKIEKLSHIMAPTPILEIARAYGLHPRLWLLISVQSSPPWGRFSLRSKHSCAFLGKGKPKNPSRSASERVLAARKTHMNALYAG